MRLKTYAYLAVGALLFANAGPRPHFLNVDIDVQRPTKRGSRANSVWISVLADGRGLLTSSTDPMIR